MTGGLNPTERTIIVGVSFVIAIVASIVLHRTGVPLAPVASTALAVPLILGASALRLRTALLLSTAIAASGVLLLVLSRVHSPLPLTLMFVSHLALGSTVGWINERKSRKRSKWRQSRSLKDHHDEEIFETALNILHFVDREGTVLRRNEASRATIGYVTKHSIQVTEYVHPEDIDTLKTELIRLFERGEIRGIKLRFVSEARTAFPVELRGTRITERLAVLEACDRSKEAELERRFMETEARYRILIENAIDTLDSGIILTDQRGEVLWANATVGRFFGIDRDRLIGVDARRARSRYVGAFENPQSLAEVMEDAIKKKERIDSMTCHVRPTLGRDERVLEYRSIPIEADRGRGGRIDHFIDITQLKRLEQSLREQTKHLELTNERLEQFSYAVSHDLKEPLRTIEAFSNILLEDYGDRLDEEGTEHLNILKRMSGRLQDMIKDMLSFARIHGEATSFERINIHRLLSEVTEHLDVRLRGVNLHVAEDLPSVRGRRVRIGELFSNLISNAIKYNDKALPTVRVGWSENGRSDMITFFVEDNGIGIESRYQEQIFGLFKKLDRWEDSEGTGAGLAICKRIVEEHGGRIWVNSDVGKGSTFFFSIPRAREVESNA